MDHFELVGRRISIRVERLFNPVPEGFFVIPPMFHRSLGRLAHYASEERVYQTLFAGLYDGDQVEVTVPNFGLPVSVPSHDTLMFVLVHLPRHPWIQEAIEMRRKQAEDDRNEEW